MTLSCRAPCKRARVSTRADQLHLTPGKTYVMAVLPFGFCDEATFNVHECNCGVICHCDEDCPPDQPYCRAEVSSDPFSFCRPWR